MSAPCTWQEIERGAVGPRSFMLRTMPDRVRAVGELWSQLHEHAVSLRGPLEKLGGLLTEADWREAMAASTRRPTSRKAPRAR